MEKISKHDRDLHLRNIIKSNLVCGNLNDLESLLNAIMSDIMDALETYELSHGINSKNTATVSI